MQLNFGKKKKLAHYNPITYKWDLYINDIFVKRFNCKKDACNYASINYPNISFNSLMNYHNSNNAKIRKKE